MKTLSELKKEGFTQFHDKLFLKKTEAVYIRLRFENQEVFVKTLDLTLEQAKATAKELTMNLVSALIALKITPSAKIFCEIGTMVIIKSYIKDENDVNKELFEKSSTVTGNKKIEFVDFYNADFKVNLK